MDLLSFHSAVVENQASNHKIAVLKGAGFIGEAIDGRIDLYMVQNIALNISKPTQNIGHCFRHH